MNELPLLIPFNVSFLNSQHPPLLSSFPTPPPSIFHLPSFLSSLPFTSPNYNQLKTLEKHFNPIVKENEEEEKVKPKEEEEKEDEEERRQKKEEINLIVKKVKDEAERTLASLDVEKSLSFFFELPKSWVGKKKGNLKRADDEGWEFIEKRNLTWSQIGDIFRTGTFLVKSNKYPMDYTWKLNSWIIKGRLRIITTLKEGCRSSFDQLEKVPKSFYHYKHNSSNFWNPTVFHSFRSALVSLRNIFSLFIGYPLTIAKNTNITSHLMLSYYRNLLEQGFEGEEALKYFYAKKNEGNIKSLYLLKEKFDKNVWKQDQAERSFRDDEDLKVKIDCFYASQLKKYMLENHSDIDSTYLQELFHFIEALQIITDNESYYNNLKSEKTSKFPFPSKSQKAALDLTLSALESEKIEKITSSLASNSDMSSSSCLFKRYLNFLDSFNQLKKIIEPKLIKHLAVSSFTLEIRLFPWSWKVEKYRKTNGQINSYLDSPFFFQLIKKKEVRHENNHFFWRMSLLLVVYRVWVQNSVFWLFANAISGPVGLRTLFGCTLFYPDKICDEKTGEVKEDPDSKTKPLIVLFGNVIQSICNDRSAFEARPDNSFFGKGFSRILNLFYNYFFKFIFVGLIGVLILFPFFVMLNVTLSFFLAVTSWIWMIIVIIFYYTFSILIHSSHRDPNLSSYFPLFYEIIDTFLIKFVIQLIFSLFSICLRPFLSFIIFSFSILRYFLRSLYDCLMMFFVFCFAKVPIEDSAMAWKIGGPGVTRVFFKQLTIEDGIQRLISYLEEKELEEWGEKMNEKLCSYKKKIEVFFEKINNPFGVGIAIQWNKRNEVWGNNLKKEDYKTDIVSLPYCIENLKEKLRTQMEERREIFITNDFNAKFSEKELETFLDCAPQIIKYFIETRSAHYLWKKLDVVQGNWSRLNEIVLSNAFTSQFRETLEEIEIRTELKLRKEKLGEIEDILEGKAWNPSDHQKIVEKHCYIDKNKVFQYKKMNERVWWWELGKINLNEEKLLGNAIRVKVEMDEREEQMVRELEEWKKLYWKENTKN